MEHKIDYRKKTFIFACFPATLSQKPTQSDDIDKVLSGFEWLFFFPFLSSGPTYHALAYSYLFCEWDENIDWTKQTNKQKNLPFVIATVLEKAKQQ